MSEPYQPAFRIDLHSHTTRSDGNDSPQEFLDSAAKIGMAVVAMTDHDVFPPDFITQDVSVDHYAKNLGIGIMRGIEVSADTHVDDCHIVGFGCDWKAEPIQWLPEIAVRSKIESYQLLVERLKNNGFDFSWSELTDGGKQGDDSVQKKHIFELIAKKGYTETWQAAKIMVRDNPDYDVKREKPDPVKTIESLHAAGGVAILAHPYLIDETAEVNGKPVSRDFYIRRLIESGLDGIETTYTYDKTSYKGTMTPAVIRNEVLERYGKLVSILSGGSDYHADHKKGTANARRIGDAGVAVDYFLTHPILPKFCEGVLPKN